MQLQLGTALILVATLFSAVLVMDREKRYAPYIAFGAAVVQALIAFGLLDFLRHVWRIEFILPALQFVAAYTVWSETERKRSVTASTVVLVVTMIELAFLLGRIR
jgi:hypothetical protein